jgi:hypothetical protein
MSGSSAHGSSAANRTYSVEPSQNCSAATSSPARVWTSATHARRRRRSIQPSPGRCLSGAGPSAAPTREPCCIRAEPASTVNPTARTTQCPNALPSIVRLIPRARRCALPTQGERERRPDGLRPRLFELCCGRPRARAYGTASLAYARAGGIVPALGDLTLRVRRVKQRASTKPTSASVSVAASSSYLGAVCGLSSRTRTCESAATLWLMTWWRTLSSRTWRARARSCFCRCKARSPFMAAGFRPGCSNGVVG